jgi:hypothetical protein
MTEPATHHRRLSTVTLRVAAILIVAGLVWSLPAVAQQQQPPAPVTRNLSGRVTDDGHEPLRGAIVKLQNPEDNSVITYITQTNGEYQFKRLNGSADYRVWATFRGHSSPVHSISKFDSHMQTVVNLTIKAY